MVTAENHSIIGGLGSAISEILGEECPVPMKRVGVKDMFVETGEDNDILEKYHLLVEDITKAAEDVLKRKK